MAPFCTGFVDMNMKQCNITETLAEILIENLKRLKRLGGHELTNLP